MRPHPLNPNSSAPPRLTWLGHSTALLEIAGKSLLTDPLLRGRVAHLLRLLPPPEPPPGADALLISHAHHDHLDPGSLRLLGRSTPIVVPRGAAGLLRRRGFRDLTELEAGEETEVGGVRIRATQAVHRPGRGPLGARSPALGYLIAREPGDADHWHAYFAGDTDLFDGMERLAGRLDLALLPVSGWGSRVGAGHLDPPRAAEAARRLAPRLAVPIHWGTLAPWSGRAAPDAAPALEFEREVAKLARSVEVRVLEPGESCEF
jgi:L-ascorbate metabolism protein UlaG (beta-lactamase superfamily)